MYRDRDLVVKCAPGINFDELWRLGFRGETEITSLAGNVLKFDDLDSSTAGSRLRGHLALTLGAETNVEGDLGLDTIDLAPGFALAIVTNQQGIGLGYYTTGQMIAVNRQLFRALSPYGVRISKIYFCPHTAADQCECRKPQGELIRRALRRMDAEIGHKRAKLHPADKQLRVGRAVKAANVRPGEGHAR